MLEQADMEVIVDAVHGVVEKLLAERLEQIYLVIEELRDGFTNTVEVLNGNDNALLGEVRKVQHATPAEVLTAAGESWERWIRSEAKAIGLRIVVPRTPKPATVTGLVTDEPILSSSKIVAKGGA